MTSTAEIIRSFREKVSAEVELEGQGLDRFIVYTPFMFDDGDHYVVILRRESQDWVLSDEGHTFMHLSYAEVDLDTGSRARLIDQALAAFRVDRREGELRVSIPDEQFGDALFSFVQALARISATALWTRDRVASTFVDDFREMMREFVPPSRLTFDYTDPAVDPEGLYAVDCRINNLPRPCFVFAVGNDQKASQATITCYHYEKRDVRFHSAVIFEDQTQINRKTLARLSAVVGRQFPSLAERPRIRRFVREDVLAAGEQGGGFIREES
jgi:hypothetical protein